MWRSKDSQWFGKRRFVLHGAGLAASFCILSAQGFAAEENLGRVPSGSSATAPVVLPVKHGAMLYGVFSGGFDATAASRYEDWLGRKSDFNVEFLTETAFEDYTGPDGKKITDSLSHLGWVLSVWDKAHRPDRNMLFSVPLATKQDRSLAHVADGQYDSTFNVVAKSIARSYPHAIIRIGWEFNADWYSWNAKGRPNDYINAFRHVAAIFKAASPDFTIDWCPAHGFSANMPAETAYPGDDAVDVIGMDFYNDYRWGSYKDDPEKRWEWYKTFSHGLEWQAKFADSHGKRMSMPEWGVNHDDPVFIEKMHGWLTSHNYAYEAYWDSNSSFTGKLSNSQYPGAAAAYKKLFSEGGDVRH